MGSISRCLIVAAILVGGFATSAAAQQTIRCPLPEARRTITDTLPADWWTTPIVDRLTSTRVRRIAGEPALVCIYGMAGTIQRKVPRGQTCTAVGTGFRCTPTGGGSARPATHATGSIEVRQTYMFDLDSGREQRSGADFWLEATTRTQLFLTPQNNAVIAVGNRANRGYAGCSRARFGRGRVSLRDIPVGSYVCVRTSDGRISQFRVNGISRGRPKTLSLGYTTWRR